MASAKSAVSWARWILFVAFALLPAALALALLAAWLLAMLPLIVPAVLLAPRLGLADKALELIAATPRAHDLAAAGIAHRRAGDGARYDPKTGLYVPDPPARGGQPGALG